MEQDSPWKDIIEALFPEFLAFFFPEICKNIDFGKGFAFLDKELQKILKNSKTGKRIVDKLVKVYLKSGDEKWLLIHVEVQGAPEKDFARRIYIYNYRIFDKFNKDVISLAVLADNQANFRENEYRVSYWGFRHSFQFPIVKLLDYNDHWELLNNSSNPFARAVKAFLKTLETEKDIQERFQSKRHLILNLYESGFTREQVIALYRFIEWIMALPEELEDRILDEVIETKGGKKVPYVLYAERRGRKEGRSEGKIIGLAEGLQQSIYDILEIRFGEEGLALFPPVKKIQDIDTLQAIRQGLKKVENLAAAQKLLAEKTVVSGTEENESA